MLQTKVTNPDELKVRAASIPKSSIGFSQRSRVKWKDGQKDRQTDRIAVERYENSVHCASAYVYPRSVFEGKIVKAGGRQVEYDAVIKDNTTSTEFHFTGSCRTTMTTQTPAYELRYWHRRQSASHNRRSSSYVSIALFVLHY